MKVCISVKGKLGKWRLDLKSHTKYSIEVQRNGKYEWLRCVGPFRSF